MSKRWVSQRITKRNLHVQTLGKVFHIWTVSMSQLWYCTKVLQDDVTTGKYLVKGTRYPSWILTIMCETSRVSKYKPQFSKTLGKQGLKKWRTMRIPGETQDQEWWDWSKMCSSQGRKPTQCNRRWKKNQSAVWKRAHWRMINTRLLWVCCRSSWQLQWDYGKAPLARKKHVLYFLQPRNLCLRNAVQCQATRATEQLMNWSGWRSFKISLNSYARKLKFRSFEFSKT